MVSQNGIQTLDCDGYNDKIPVESYIAGVPKSVNPSHERVDSGRKALPISFFFTNISAKTYKLNCRKNVALYHDYYLQD